MVHITKSVLLFISPSWDPFWFIFSGSVFFLEQLPEALYIHQGLSVMPPGHELHHTCGMWLFWFCSFTGEGSPHQISCFCTVALYFFIGVCEVSALSSAFGRLGSMQSCVSRMGHLRWPLLCSHFSVFLSNEPPFCSHSHTFWTSDFSVFCEHVLL
jgi:hypothetical protein